MEVEINKEILNYREGMFFGLPLRELIAILVAIVCSGVAYYFFGNVMLCAGVSLPPILIGFVNYHGMNGGKALLVIVQDMVGPQHLVSSRTDMAITGEAAKSTLRSHKEKVRENRREKRTKNEHR